MPSRERKEQYFAQMQDLISSYKNILVVHADHVGSLQLQKIRKALRGEAVVLMGKNTMMRRCITNYLIENKEHPIENILPLVVGNIGFIFTNGDLGDVRTVIDANTVPAAAKVGVMAACDVIVPPGPTGCDPGQTSWFQALNVPTKISKGQIEIISELKLISKGDRVGGSEAALLQKLDIRPFTYGLVLVAVYNNGSVFDAKVLDLTDDDLKAKVRLLVECDCFG
jgi:large subunit ribosomal protein LP0